eukprot:CAMPEP_0194748276 /NCGR_PEP_ID=MMETSP0323_2-20130528/2431_1 /TAXON_ID=2866 ORGANISM="Crypthecodinium cohnii, Strain Seligo" /NCGR_SAMPLE_ID=MMETSP0323_2 /ASSEMBLY_ACC=CAM_ASM_000346 /LENGTH=298 /DNA_ID=CAMNT_0039662397 /DNA_START=80 /DNA_END=976 /DNA_ORIENTATION=-
MSSTALLQKSQRLAAPRLAAAAHQRLNWVRPHCSGLLGLLTQQQQQVRCHSGHGNGHSHGGGHGHTHEHLDSPGLFEERENPLWATRDWTSRAFTVGLGGPVGSGKTALTLKLCQELREQYSLGVVTNDIFTREDAEFLRRNSALAPERIQAVETGGCPHAAIREDITSNLIALENLTVEMPDIQLLLCESGGDNLAANFSRELADFTIYVIDVAGGDKVPRKGGPGITQSDLLVVNKIDLAEAVGADLDVMRRDSKKMRGDGPTVFAAVKNGVGVPEIAERVLAAWALATKQGSKAK